MKETKVKINFNLKEYVDKTKEKVNKVKEKIKNNLNGKDGLKLNKQNVKYYSVLLLMIAVAVASTYANIISFKEANKEDYVTHTLNKEEVSAINNSVESKNDDEEKEEQNVNAMSTNYEIAMSSISTVAKVEEQDTIFPVSNGKVITEYSMENVIYYQDLGVWKTHSGVDISCDENAEVYAVISGKVIGIYNDDVLGYSVVVEGEEYTAIYSSLSKDILVDIGNVIEKQDKIGYATINPAEQSLGAHVHFELMKDGEFVNPDILGIK